MSKSKFFVLGSVLFLFGYGSCLILNDFFANKPLPHSSIDNLNVQISECKSENIRLVKRINEISAVSSFAQSEHTAPTKKEPPEKIHPAEDKKAFLSKTDNSATEEQLQMLSNYIIENETKKHQAFLDSIHATPENLPQALNDNYKKDTVDAAWAPDKKALIDDYISKNSLLKTLPNVESDCKSKQCRISILSDDQNAIGQLTQNLSGLTNSSEFGTYTFSIDEKTHSTSIYLDRKYN